jgi:hypothetical protein
MKHFARRALLATALLSTGCVPIYIDRERYQDPYIVQGFAPRSAEKTAEYNETLLTAKFESGRLYDPAIDPARRPVPGHQTEEIEEPANESGLADFPGRSHARGRHVVSKPAEPLSFGEERKFFRNPGQALPANCVALSGGGVRSAAFGMGVLMALHEEKKLQEVDILSAVSGGAYTVSWYYAQHMHRRNVPPGELDSRLFDPDGEYQTFLAENTRLLNPVSYAALAATNLVAIPLNFVTNAIFGWHLNTTPAQKAYELRVRNVFHRDPGRKLRTFNFHQIGRMLGDDVGPESPADESGDDAKAAEGTTPAGAPLRKKLPYFIISATAFIEATSDYHSAPLRNSVYEFTPLMFGSDAYGRYRYDPGTPSWPMTLGLAVAVSGAALDGTKLIAGNTQRTLWSALNQDLGYYMNNPALHPSAIPQHNVLPFPLYFAHHYPRDVRGTHIYLSDGGHSENLGAYSLMRRLCKRIVIVDAEHDPTYEFDAYFNLKSGIKRDMGVELNVPDIENLKDLELKELRRDKAARSDPGLRKSLAAVPDATGMASGDPLVDPLDSRRWNAVAQKPVMEGTVACLPHPDLPGRTLSVQYVKLAYRPTEKECESTDNTVKDCDADLLTRDLCWRDRIIKGRKDKDAQVALHYFCLHRGTKESRMSTDFFTSTTSLFPQQPTTDQNFSEWQFRAYRNLGNKLMEDALRENAERKTAACERK